jgi:DNA-directed RNA polymerase subunit beta'
MNKDIFYNKTINKKELKTLIQSTFQSYGIVTTTHLTEGLKKSGFSFATKAGISISIEDLKVPPTKDTLFSKNNTNIKLAYYYEKRGNTNEIERFQKVIDTWHTTSEILKNQLVDYFKTVDPLNPVYMMAFSGARGNLSQVRQLVGMRGLMADPNGQIIDLPIKTNFREGLSITDYVISSYGARKGIVDTALRTADSGYLTRRLVDVAQHVIIRELDCQTRNGIRLIYDPEHSKIEQYIGRVLSKSVKNQGSTQIVIKKDTALTKENLSSLTSVVNLVLRSPLICESSRSICQKCYGWNLSQGQLVELADAVGIIAAQSIGEPGTQLTMRTFHTGGVFTGESNSQIRSVFDGQVLFASTLKTSVSRTLYGEIILKALNLSEVFILNKEKKRLKRCCITPEMLIFVPNKGFINNGDLIAESPLLNKRTTTRMQNIFSSISGEIQFQNIVSTQGTKILSNGLIWVASGQVYDILPNMLIKSQEDIIVKNGAIAQTKITSRISGMLKADRTRTMLLPSYIINSLLLSSSRNFYQTSGGELFLINKSNEVYLITNNSRPENSKQQNFTKKRSRKYTLLTDHTIHYSRTKMLRNNEINGTCIFLLNPYKTVSRVTKGLSAVQNHVIPNIEQHQLFDKKILYPGEIIIEGIEITTLSYCQVSPLNKKSLSLTIWPLKQWIVSKSIDSLNAVNNIFFTKNLNNTVCKSTISMLFQNNSKVLANETFVDIGYDFINRNGLIKRPVFKLLNCTKQNLKHFAFFETFMLPTNFVGMDKKQINTSYLNTNNQYIQPYCVIATVNCLSIKTIKIQNLKNLKSKPNRFLIATKGDYKTYIKTHDYKSVNSKFVVVGDKIGHNHVTNYSGYKIHDCNAEQLKIRIGTPFFVSTGTRIIIQHGSLIQHEESLFQFLYTRVISSDIVTGLPRIEQLLESRGTKNSCQLIERPGVIIKRQGNMLSILEKCKIRIYEVNDPIINLLNKGELVTVAKPLDSLLVDPHKVLKLYFKYYCSFYAFENAAKRSVINIQILLVNLIQEVYNSQGIYISNKHVEVIIRQITSKVKISEIKTETSFEIGEFLEFEQARYINLALLSTKKPMIEYQPVLLGITKVSLMTESFISSASFQETTRVLTKAAIEGKVEWLRGLKENVILGRLVPAGTGFKAFNSLSLLNVRLT